MSATGTVYGLGVGPGDPELLTLKALRLLRAAPVIAYPVTESGDSFARAIVAGHLSGSQAEIAVATPMRDSAAAQQGYDRAATDIGTHLRAGRDVAVLCEGDPFLYGSFAYLFRRLAEDFPVVAVPGVSALNACACAAGMPLVARNEMLTVVPALLPDERLRMALAAADTVAVFKVGRHLPRLRTLLGELSLRDRAWLVERATTADQRIVPLAEAGDTAPYFSVLLVAKRPEAWR